ncbi:MAG: DUF4175 domain-containing protein [Paracoccaceae bacterium]
MTTKVPNPQAVLYRLRWPLRLGWAGLFAERLVRGFWPVWTLLLGYAAGFSLGLQDYLSIEALWAVLVLGLGAFVWFVVSGVRRFRWPTRAEALARLDARLKGQPLATLLDRQAVGLRDDDSVAVWRAHLVQMADRAARARAPKPDLRISRLDPFALRYLALTAFVVALLFGSLWRVSEVAGLAPGGGVGPALASGPAWEGWAEPPAYTGKPALYLNDIPAGEIALPQGTVLTFRLYGEVGALGLTETVSGREAAPEAETGPSQGFEVTRSGAVSVTGPGGRDWQVAMLADAAPSVETVGVMEREASGEMRQSFRARDDYAVVAGHAEITLDLGTVDRRHGLAVAPEPREAIVLDLPMPFTGRRDDFSETLVDDLSKHPWANLPIRMRLLVEDGQGQAGQSEPLVTPLPGRRFFDPLASALIEMRRDLMWSTENGKRVAQVLHAISHRPEGFIRNERAYLLLRVAMRRLDGGLDEAGAGRIASELRDEVAEALWEIASLVEEGDLASALERLQRAQDRLAEAIRNGATKSEIDELMQEMNEALDDYIQQLAEEAQRNPDQQSAENQDGMQMSGDQLQQMLEKLQELMEQGRMAEAQELLEQLRQFMENMQVTLNENGEGRRSPGQRALEGLNDTLRDQQGLSDDSFQRLQNPENNGRMGQNEQQGENGEGQPQRRDAQPGEGPRDGQGGGGDDARDLAERQRELRDRLAEQQNQRLPGDGTPEGEAARDALDRAGRAMDEAEEALRDDDLSGALDRQAEAMEALRDGMRNMGRALAEEQRREEGGQGQAFGGQNTDGRRDPLGREIGQAGGLGTDENLTQGEDVYRRAREILDELRRRSGEQDRPRIELDYLRRLLDRF